MNSWPYNTARWQRLRLAVLSSQPLCRYCSEMGRTTLATEVDHIKPVRLAPDLAFVQDNLQGLCKPCHDGVKRLEEITGRRVGCGVDGMPLDGWPEYTAERSGPVVFVVGPMCSGKTTLCAGVDGWAYVGIDACRAAARSEAEAWHRLESLIDAHTLVESAGINQRLALVIARTRKRFAVRVVAVTAPVSVLLARLGERGDAAEKRATTERLARNLSRECVAPIDAVVLTDCERGEARRRFRAAIEGSTTRQFSPAAHTNT